MHPIEADRPPVGVVEFHVGPAAGVGGNGNPVRAEEAGRAFDEVALAGDTRPVDHTILTCFGDSLIGRNVQERAGIRGVRAGDVFLRIAGPVAVRIRSGLESGIPSLKMELERSDSRIRPVSACLGNEARPLGEAEAWSK